MILSDNQLIELFEIIKAQTHPKAVEYFWESIKEGASLDSIFYTNNEEGYELDLKWKSENEYLLAFGYVSRSLIGDGGEWILTIKENKIQNVHSSIQWIS